MAKENEELLFRSFGKFLLGRLVLFLSKVFHNLGTSSGEASRDPVTDVSAVSSLTCLVVHGSQPPVYPSIYTCVNAVLVVRSVHVVPIYHTVHTVPVVQTVHIKRSELIIHIVHVVHTLLIVHPVHVVHMENIICIYFTYCTVCTAHTVCTCDITCTFLYVQYI